MQLGTFIHIWRSFFVFLRYVPRGKIVRSFIATRVVQTLQSYQYHMKGSNFSTSSPTFFIFLIAVILLGMKWYLLHILNQNALYPSIHYLEHTMASLQNNVSITNHTLQYMTCFEIYSKFLEPCIYSVNETYLSI